MTHIYYKNIASGYCHTNQQPSPNAYNAYFDKLCKIAPLSKYLATYFNTCLKKKVILQPFFCF